MHKLWLHPLVVGASFVLFVAYCGSDGGSGGAIACLVVGLQWLQVHQICYCSNDFVHLLFRGCGFTIVRGRQWPHQILPLQWWPCTTCLSEVVDGSYGFVCLVHQM